MPRPRMIPPFRLPNAQGELHGSADHLQRREMIVALAHPSCETCASALDAFHQRAARIDAGEDLYILDVRQPEEEVEGTIPGAHLIPLPSLPERLVEIPADREILVHCRGGGRSSRAVKLLRQAGVRRAVNIAGGINAWNALDR